MLFADDGWVDAGSDVLACASTANAQSASLTAVLSAISVGFVVPKSSLGRALRFVGFGAVVKNHGIYVLAANRV
jgi:hypothetical protein